MSTSYISTHGTIWGEISDTGVTTSYGHDALGSVTETFVSGAVQNTYRYKPYGATLTKTGAGADPSFLCNGGTGYRASSLSKVSHYVRARHYSSACWSWTSVDQWWPPEPAYIYMAGNPGSGSDYSGNSNGITGVSGGSPMPLCDCCPTNAWFVAAFLPPGSSGFINRNNSAACRQAWAGFSLDLWVTYNLSPLQSPDVRVCKQMWIEAWNIVGPGGTVVNDGLVSMISNVPAASDPDCNFSKKDCSSAECNFPDQPGGCPLYMGTGNFVKGSTYTIQIQVTLIGTRDVYGFNDAECGVSASFYGTTTWGDSPTTIVSHSP